MKRILIVGAAGQVGRGLLRAFRGISGMSAAGVTRTEFSAAPLRAEGHEIRAGSVTDPRAAPGLLEGADMLVNCALAVDRPNAARRRNEALLDGLLRHGEADLLVHLSSVAVYGSCLDSQASSFDAPLPDSTYAGEKLRLERRAAAMARDFGRRLLVLRLGHVYGPGQALSRDILQALHERRWPLPFGGRLHSNAIHIESLARALGRLAEAPPGAPVLNAVDAPQRSWGELYGLHAAAAALPEPLPMPEDESDGRRREFRRRSRAPLPLRLLRELGGWARGLPAASAVDLPAVRQTVESLLLALPAGVEGFVDRRYALFSARRSLDDSRLPSPLPPPWYYSDAVPGPGAPTAGLDSDADRHVAELRAWRLRWAEPAWRVSRAGRPI